MYWFFGLFLKRRDQVIGVDLDCGIADRGYKKREMIEHDATGKCTKQKFTRFYVRWNCILKTVRVRLRLKPQVGSEVDRRLFGTVSLSDIPPENITNIL